jgi:PPOX class probable F420-dependent enzyme
MSPADRRRKAMEFEQVRPFMETHHRGVITTFQADGLAQSSVVVCGAYQGHAAFCIVRGSSRKARNLRRDPRCTVLAVTKDWRSWVTVEGEAKLYDYHNTDAEEMRVLLRDIFNACGDHEHSDWEEYDQAMVKQDAVVVLVTPQRVYGQLR